MSLDAAEAGEPTGADDDFLWGVATSAYQSEGGYNLPGGPHTNWAYAEFNGHVDRLGQAADFWNRYLDDFAAARRVGLNAFRLGIEWSRVQPSASAVAGPAPEFDPAALDGYGDMLAQCRAEGLEPVVTLHHFVHPAWLGSDAWLCEQTLAHFLRYVRTAVTHVNRRLVLQGQVPIRYYLTVNEPNMLVLNTYLGTQFPSGARRGLANALTASDLLLTAHVEAYNLIHDIHASEGWATPQVSLNNYCSDLYWADKLFLDLLTIRERGIEPHGMAGHIRSKASEFARALKGWNIPLRRDWAALLGRAVKWFSEACAYRLFRPEHFPRLQRCLAQSPRSRVLDFVALDYYDPFSAHTFRRPVFWDHDFIGGSLFFRALGAMTSKWWDWQVTPRGLSFFCEYYSRDLNDLPVLIAENGMAIRRRLDNVGSPRTDGVTRSEFLRLHIAEVNALIDAGVPLFGYLHWSLFDNYEWGTYSPRFGLFSLDYQQGTERLTVDQHGDCASHTYASLVRAARRGRK